MNMTEIILKPTQVKTLYENTQKISEGIKMIKAMDVWGISKKGKGIVIAIIDTGCEINHPDLKENIISGYNFTEDDNSNPNIYKDYRGHGTHVAGIIAASDNGKGIVGVAPESKLLILKVIDKNGVGSYKNLIKAIEFSMNWKGPNKEKVSIINISLGGSLPDKKLYTTIKKAKKKGIVIIAASGNEGDGNENTNEISFPGFYKEVIQVGSITKDKKPSKFSNTNINLDFVAPGENIISTHLNNNYVQLSGTSMAAPYVTGAIALIIKMIGKQETEILPYLVKFYLIVHSQRLGFPNTQEGYGLIQLK
ncbi:S8 family peptidase [Bacillus sp. SM-B1]|nr:S8 family peptidase [Bacillus sp. SM-B1]HDR3650537.1 S8 family peptidase [Bacillus anthracis]HDR3653290.1 S8 family peptidase [Bacillus anthracis]